MDARYVVLKFIGLDKENAITRDDLCNKTGIADRKVRELIEQLRKEGYFILNDNDGKGYYRCVDIPNLLKYYWSEWRRAISILSRLTMMRKFLTENGCDMNPNHLKHEQKKEQG